MAAGSSFCRPVAIKALERIERPALESKLAVVVVLDDHGTPMARPGEQRDAPLQRHRDAERELMRRRHVDEPGGARDGRHVDAVRVHRDADHSRTKPGEEVPDPKVTWIFDRDAGARLQQDAPDQVKRLLCSMGDQHVIGGGTHRP